MGYRVPYTEQEVQFIKEFWYFGPSAIASILGRNKESMKHYMYEHNVYRKAATKEMLARAMLALITENKSLKGELEKVKNESIKEREDVYEQEALH